MKRKTNISDVPRLVAYGATDVGKMRDNNEDCYFCDDEKGIFIVIDGMGGHSAGEVAARTALEKIRTFLEDSRLAETKEKIRLATISANNAIIEQAETKREWHNMQCVLTVALIEGEKIIIGHVGDTRLYKISAGVIKKITHDHSPAGVLEELQHMSELEAMELPNRNEVFKSLGAESIAQENTDFVELLEAPLLPGEAILLCSDGLSDLLTSVRILGLVQQHEKYPAAIVNNLIHEANAAGGKDNITVVYARRSAAAASRGIKDWLRYAVAGLCCGVFLTVAAGLATKRFSVRDAVLSPAQAAPSPTAIVEPVATPSPLIVEPPSPPAAIVKPSVPAKKKQPAKSNSH